MGMRIIEDNVDLSGIENLLIKDGKYIPVPSSSLNQFSIEQIMIFAHKHALYQFPTLELIEWLKLFIGNSNAIEIGAGNGCIGRSLEIPLTDNRMQEWDSIKLYYNAIHQPTITYGSDVETLPALEAIQKYTPDIVVACWVTQLKKPYTKNGNMHGIDELKLLEMVDTYILVGNHNIHSGKEIFTNVPTSHTLRIYEFDWLVSRQSEQEKNRIYVWNRK